MFNINKINQYQELLSEIENFNTRETKTKQKTENVSKINKENYYKKIQKFLQECKNFFQALYTKQNTCTQTQNKLFQKFQKM